MLVIPPELQTQVRRRLEQEYFVWMTTVGSDLSPQPRPVWFIWEDDSFLIYSQPRAHKVHHVRLHPRVALHFNADASGDNDILIFIGIARIDEAAPHAHRVPAYLRKYQDGIAALNMTPREMGDEYSLAIRVTPNSVRGG